MESPQIVILGAGQPFVGTEPSALIHTSGDKRVLDWVLEAFKQALEDPEFHFVGGYRITEIVGAYPDIHFSQNEDWDSSGTVASLFTAPISAERPVYMCYSDTIFEENAVKAIEGTTAIAVDGNWRTRYKNRSDESLERAEKVQTIGESVREVGTDIEVNDSTAEFTGLLRLSPEAVEQAQKLWESGIVDSDADIPDLLRACIDADVEIGAVDINGHWAELESAEDLSRFVLDTKANTLRRLRSMVEQSTILDQYTVTVDQWNTSPDEVTSAIGDYFAGERVIVRSSALDEDGWNESNAGRFESVLDVPSHERQAVKNAITKVTDSYTDSNPENQVLVQPMIDSVEQSGVIMTRSLDTGSPYYIINYDATTTSTESVTDGTGKHLQTAVVRKDQFDTEEHVEPTPQHPSNLSLGPLLQAVREIETLIGHDSLDIEFAIDDNGEVFVLQSRPMTLDPAERTVDDKNLFEAVDRGREEFVESQSPTPFLLGDRTIYGVMPDWNPAEIIGRQCRRLAASIYQYLIMDEVWAQQRAEYGYRDVRPHPLMKRFAGQPYVDIRADFNSFVPASVPDELAERLVQYYLNRLESHPELHDKVEFEVVLTCLTFNYRTQIQPMIDAGFTKEELIPLRDGLREITLEAFSRIDEDIRKIERLDRRHTEICNSDLSPLKSASFLLRDCRRLGTLPFAHLARTAFVATSLLRSLERIGVLTATQKQEFQNSLDTVARQFERDGQRVAEDNLAWDTFVERYGHLRPGTYEITSARYKQNPEKYLTPVVNNTHEAIPKRDPTEIWSEDTKEQIEHELSRIGLPTDTDTFIEFLAKAIEEREHSKFVFSRNLSEALEQIAEFGQNHGLSREELSHIPLEMFLKLSREHPPTDVTAWLTEQANEGREQYTTTCAVELPPILFDESDFTVFERPAREPNFVTNNRISAEIIELEGADSSAEDIDGKIVVIKKADPGYDWLFGHDVAGLVTMYGGANSHMAVRAAEFSLPAAIGIGENRYELLQKSEIIELDCSKQSIEVVQ
ncbi:PEP/pyruvate-binding domain-containing protein [Haloarcula nitratireducens]|uniref:Uncharacterized protein n=1 Tax=Haloarcula nitratireducens TaxID=2487749 RepID=A0AAW4PJY0_9EURY|nr:PEP/pyruvate-binding domain-containing protein [Halomicroarcula nitratireducens]MBX0297761.1 hypothetical protein [Halomicroarcula nitratireducens]